MPIRINFLAEQQEAEEMRRRDPLKRAIWGGGAIVLAGVAWCLVMQVKLSAVDKQLAGKTEELNKISKASKEVGDNLKKITEIGDRETALKQLAANRMLWGPVFNSLQMVMTDVTPGGQGGNCPVQLLQLRSAQTYTYAEGAKAKPGGPKAKPATSTEKVVITLEGRDYGTEAEQNYNKLKEKLALDPYLKEQLRKENPVRLQNFYERQSDAADPNKSFVRFVLEVNYPERTR